LKKYYLAGAHFCPSLPRAKKPKNATLGQARVTFLSLLREQGHMRGTRHVTSIGICLGISFLHPLHGNSTPPFPGPGPGPGSKLYEHPQGTTLYPNTYRIPAAQDLKKCQVMSRAVTFPKGINQHVDSLVFIIPHRDAHAREAFEVLWDTYL
jgi:hypothetical protein